MSRVLHFEIPADDTGRATAFYRDVFGWTFQSWEGPMEYHLATTGAEGPGIDGAVHPRAHPGQGVVNTIGVASLDEVVARVQAHGGTLVAPRMAIPGIGWLAYANDTEGNTFGILQPDPAAQ